MLSFLRRRRYRNAVHAQMQAAMFEPHLEFLGKLQALPSLADAIDGGFNAKRTAEAQAMQLSSAMLSDAISGLDTDRRESIEREVTAWFASPDFASRFLASAQGAEGIPGEMDPFQWKIQWAVTYAYTQQARNLIDVRTRDLFCGEVLAALAGLFADDVADPGRVLREGDAGAVLPLVERGAVPQLSGIEYRVRPIATGTGIILVRADNGQQLTERRSLTQDDLGKLPLDAEGYLFINLRTFSGDLCSCLIVEPEGEPFGDKRAFWWSLARACVVNVDALAARTRMTRAAFDRVSSDARAMWDSAIAEVGSIEHMRDLWIPMRNTHLTVIEQLKDQQTSDAAKLGLDIALAMVLATQSEDRSLEAYAYQRFKRFLWLPGEEPPEFYVHDDEPSV